MSERYARCPRCRGDQLAVHEVTEIVGVTDHGRVRIEAGQIAAPSPFWFEPGLVVRVTLSCGSCGHEWRSRRSVAATVTRRWS